MFSVSYMYRYAYIHTYIHACMHACIHACMHTYICIHTHTYKYILAYIHTHACMHACIRTYTQLDGPECRARRLLPKDASTKGSSCPASLHPMCILHIFAPACFLIACVHLLSCPRSCSSTRREQVRASNVFSTSKDAAE